MLLGKKSFLFMCKKILLHQIFQMKLLLFFIIIIDFSDYCLHHLLLLQTSFLVSEHLLLIFRLQVPSSCPDGLPSISAELQTSEEIQLNLVKRTHTGEFNLIIFELCKQSYSYNQYKTHKVHKINSENACFIIFVYQVAAFDNSKYTQAHM